MPVQIAACDSVDSNVPIDGFVAVQEDALAVEVAGDLLRAPALSEVPMNGGKLGDIELGVAAERD